MRKLLNHNSERVETGAIQVGDDWPGTFIRGDNSFAYAVSLVNLLANPNDQIAKIQVKNLIETLLECNLNKGVADFIKQQV